MSMTDPVARPSLYEPGDGWVAWSLSFCLSNRLVVVLLMLLLVGAGLYVMPFEWEAGAWPRNPVAVDAIPDLGENQQIVYTEWRGRSPQDVEDQITYPLTARLLNVPGVQTVRSMSMFGFSTIYVVFEEGVDFYWSRDRLQERLNAIPPEDLPDGVRPRLGPDATPVGQIFWYTLEGRDRDGNPTGGWDPQELRAIQDWKVRLELLSVPGVAEVASVGGFVPEYQVEVDPSALHAHDVTLPMVINAVRLSNTDVGARTIEIQSAEYLIRGLGFVRRVEDIEEAVVTVRNHAPIRVRDVARVVVGPAERRGVLDKDGAEAVGGVVVAQYGANPMQVLRAVHTRLAEIESQGTLDRKIVPMRNADGTTRMVESRVTVVPFYDRSNLIRETLHTLGEALRHEILITILVVIWLLANLRSSFLISLILPLAVLLCFVVMKAFGVTANVVALAGIAIAIGTIVDMGIILTENIMEHMDRAPPGTPPVRVVYRAAREVGSAVLTAVATTVIGFMPILILTGEQGKLYRPLAFTNMFALTASLVVALTILPVLACWLFRRTRLRASGDETRAGASSAAARIVPARSTQDVTPDSLPDREPRSLDGRQPGQRSRWRRWIKFGANATVFCVVLLLLARDWMPMGLANGLLPSLLFTGGAIAGVLLLFQGFLRVYEPILRWCLHHRFLFLLVPTTLFVFALSIFRGMGQELMPRLDEGAFLYMPSTMPHASIGEGSDVLRIQGMAIHAIPEVENAVGKLGRAESPLDPAPIGMIETIINYKDEFLRDDDGSIPLFAYDPHAVALEADRHGVPLHAPDGETYFVRGLYLRDADGHLLPDARGRPFRQWRRPLDPAHNPGRTAWAGIRHPDDIWDEVVRVTQIPGVTSASKLGPIETRNVMLQSGLRGQVGIAIRARGGVDLESLQTAGLAIEQALRTVPSIRPESLAADRVTGKPYLELDIDREAISRYGLTVQDVQTFIQAAIGGVVVTQTIEGRERYNVLVRYMRELRDSPEAILRALVPIRGGGHVPLQQLLRDGEIRFRRGPSVIKSENGALVMYISFGIREDVGVVDAVREAMALLSHLQDEGGFNLPGGRLPGGIGYEFIGAYKKAIEVREKMMVLIPAALLIIFLLLYLQFRRVSTTAIVFSGVAVACSGGFLLLWLYGQPWFLDVTILEVNLRDLFQMHPVRMSTAIAVGFLALFGIATDDGVVMATYLDESFAANRPVRHTDVLEATVLAAKRRVRPCLMTTATTILALLPVLTSQGRGADIMVPMAIPIVGGMIVELMTMFVVPVLYSMGHTPDPE